MIPRLSAASCAAMLFALGVAPADAALNAYLNLKGQRIVTVGVGPEKNRVIVTFHLGTGPVSWAYDPGTGTITQLPQVVENVSPNSGIGIVVKKNPGTAGTHRLTANSNGTTFDLPETMDPGNYDIVVTVPAHAVNTKGTGAQNVRMSSTATGASMTSASASKSLPAQTMLLTFHVVVDAKGKLRLDSNVPMIKPAIQAL